MPPTSCRALVKDYCSNCTFAGVHFIADDTKHWSERWLWFLLVVLCWYGSALLIIAAWDAFVLSPISFGVETTYTEWNTKMPAVAVCEIVQDKQYKQKIYDVSDSIWTPDHLLDLEDALEDITYFRGSCHTLVDVCYNTKEPDYQCPMSNYSYYANLVRCECPQLLKQCSYNGKLFPCCEYFQPIDTEIGRCYIINSIQTKEPNPYPMVSNLTNKRGVLRFEVMLGAMIYTLGEDEVPTITTLQSSTLKLQLGHIFKRHVAVKNIENDPLVTETTPEQRACFFHHENEKGLYPHYSYSACTVLCRKKAQLDICQCNDHFMLGTSEAERCNISGMACLNANSNNLTTLKPRWATRPGMVCDCTPSCTETEITVIKDVQTSGSHNSKKAIVHVILARMSTERFKRNVVRSRLDLVVSLGGTTGLFLGASLLSFVEFIVYFTVRFTSNILIEQRKNQNVKPKHKRAVRF
ncbi:sodium channel protein Nach-like [Pectinophora gossypiella]|uniref:sodium channel protein Nach-like n=1 Tax=Pectinophora gossypiella TaxID=13191 RepID=UPI00214EBCAC|nr:sodium channel protein Nach-like [Pectinophora gossypiella]